MPRAERDVPQASPPPSEPLPASHAFLVAIVLVLLGIGLFLVKEFLGALVLALLLAFLLQRPYWAVVKRVKYPSLAAWIMLLVVSVAIVLPVALIVRELVDQSEAVLDFAKDPEGIEAALAEVLDPFNIDRFEARILIARGVEAGAGLIQSSLLGILERVPHLLAGLVVFLFTLFFGLRDGPALVRTLRDYTPLHPRVRDHLYTLVGARTRAIALGTFLVSIVQGVAAGFGWWIFGFPAPVFWGVVMTVLAVLPLGAPFLVLVPAGVVALLQQDWFSGIGILVWAGLVVGLIDDMLRPYVVGRSAGVHPAIILIGTLGGLLVFGVSGFLLGPLALGMIGPALEVWAEERRENHRSA